MFEKRRCHFTHIFELFARYIYAIIVITASIAFNMAGSIASDKEIVEDVKEASGFVMSADALAVLAVVGVLLLVSLIMLLYCAFKWRYTFVSAEENTVCAEYCGCCEKQCGGGNYYYRFIIILAAFMFSAACAVCS